MIVLTIRTPLPLLIAIERYRHNKSAIHAFELNGDRTGSVDRLIDDGRAGGADACCCGGPCCIEVRGEVEDIDVPADVEFRVLDLPRCWLLMEVGAKGLGIGKVVAVGVFEIFVTGRTRFALSPQLGQR